MVERAQSRPGARPGAGAGTSSRSSIEVDAPAAEVLAVIADLPAYPQWVDHLTTAEVLTTTEAGRPATVRMVLQHPLLSDDYTLGYDWSTPDTVSWTLVDGQVLKAMDGSYTLATVGDRTTVTYTLAVDVSLPLPGLLRRRAEKTIIDGALKGLKKRVER